MSGFNNAEIRGLEKLFIIFRHPPKKLGLVCRLSKTNKKIGFLIIIILEVYYDL